MAEKNFEHIELQLVHEQTWFQRHRQKLAGAGVVATSMTVASTANAAIAETILTAVTGEVTAVMNSQEAIYGLLIVVLVGFLIWRYGKRTVNSG